MHILIDMDDTMVDLFPVWSRMYELVTGRSIPEVHDYSFSGCFETQRERNNFFSLIDSEMVFENLRPSHMAVESINRIIENNMVSVVSSPITPRAAAGKFEWMRTCRRRFGLMLSDDDLILSRNKWVVSADMIIDDCPRHLRQFGGHTACLDSPVNAMVDVDIRAKSWPELADRIMCFGD